MSAIFAAGLRSMSARAADSLHCKSSWRGECWKTFWNSRYTRDNDRTAYSASAASEMLC
jgi:hypothetical protein